MIRLHRTHRPGFHPAGSAGAASMVHSFAYSRAFLVDSAIKLPAAAPLTMLAVMPSIPADAPCAAFDAACSMLDRPVLTLLIGALALFTSTSTTSSSLLLSAMGRRTVRLSRRCTTRIADTQKSASSKV